MRPFFLILLLMAPSIWANYIVSNSKGTEKRIIKEDQMQPGIKLFRYCMRLLKPDQNTDDAECGNELIYGKNKDQSDQHYLAPKCYSHARYLQCHEEVNNQLIAETYNHIETAKAALGANVIGDIFSQAPESCKDRKVTNTVCKDKAKKDCVQEAVMVRKCSDGQTVDAGSNDCPGAKLVPKTEIICEKMTLPNDIFFHRRNIIRTTMEQLERGDINNAGAVGSLLANIPQAMADEILKVCPDEELDCVLKQKDIWREKMQGVYESLTTNLDNAYYSMIYFKYQCDKLPQTFDNKQDAKDKEACNNKHDYQHDLYISIGQPVGNGGDGGSSGQDLSVSELEVLLAKKRPKAFKHCQKKWKDGEGKDIINHKGKNMYKFCLEYNLNPPPHVKAKKSEAGKGSNGQGTQGDGTDHETIKAEIKKLPKAWQYPNASTYLEGKDCKTGDMETGCQVRLHELQRDCENFAQNPEKFKWILDTYFDGQPDGCRILNTKMPELSSPPANRTRPEACYLLNRLLERKKKIDSCRHSARQVKIRPTTEIEFDPNGELLCPEEYAPYNCRAENTGKAGDMQKFLHDPKEMDGFCRAKVRGHITWCEAQRAIARQVNYGLYFAEEALCSAVETKFAALNSEVDDPPKSCEIWFKDIKKMAHVPPYEEISSVAKASVESGPMQDLVMGVSDIMRHRGMVKLGKYSMEKRMETTFLAMANHNDKILDVDSKDFSQALKELFESSKGCLTDADKTSITAKLKSMAVDTKKNMDMAKNKNNLKSTADMEQEWHRQYVVAAREFKIRKCQQENCQSHKGCKAADVNRIEAEITHIASSYAALEEPIYTGNITREKYETDQMWEMRLSIDKDKHTKKLFEWLTPDFYSVSCDSSDERNTREDDSPQNKPIEFTREHFNLIKKGQKIEVNDQLSVIKDKFCDPKKDREANLFKEGRGAVAFSPLIDGFMSCQDIPEDKNECDDRKSFGWTLCADKMYLIGEEYKENKKWLTKFAKTMVMAVGAIAAFVVIATNPYLALAAGTLLGGYEIREAYLDYRKGIAIERGERRPDMEVLAAHSDFVNGRINYSAYRKVYDANKGDTSVAKLMGTVVFETLMAALDVHTVGMALKGVMGAKKFAQVLEAVQIASKMDEATKARFMESILEGKMLMANGEAITLNSRERELLWRQINASPDQAAKVADDARDSMGGGDVEIHSTKKGDPTPTSTNPTQTPTTPPKVDTPQHPVTPKGEVPVVVKDTPTPKKVKVKKEPVDGFKNDKAFAKKAKSREEIFEHKAGIKLGGNVEGAYAFPGGRQTYNTNYELVIKDARVDSMDAARERINNWLRAQKEGNGPVIVDWSVKKNRDGRFDVRVIMEDVRDISSRPEFVKVARGDNLYDMRNVEKELGLSQAESDMLKEDIVRESLRAQMHHPGGHPLNHFVRIRKTSKGYRAEVVSIDLDHGLRTDDEVLDILKNPDSNSHNIMFGKDPVPVTRQYNFDSMKERYMDQLGLDPKVYRDKITPDTVLKPDSPRARDIGPTTAANDAGNPVVLQTNNTGGKTKVGTGAPNGKTQDAPTAYDTTDVSHNPPPKQYETTLPMEREQRNLHKKMLEEKKIGDDMVFTGNNGNRNQRVIAVDMKRQPHDPSLEELKLRVDEHAKMRHDKMFSSLKPEDALAHESKIISDYSEYLKAQGVPHEIVYDVRFSATDPNLDRRVFFIRITPMEKGGHRLNRMAFSMQKKMLGTDLIFEPRMLAENNALGFYRADYNQISMSYDDVRNLDTTGQTMMHELEHRYRDVKLIKQQQKIRKVRDNESIVLDDFYGSAKVTTDGAQLPGASTVTDGYNRFMSFDEVGRSMGDVRRDLAYMDSILTGSSKRAKGMLADNKSFDAILEDAIKRNALAKKQIAMSEDIYGRTLTTLNGDTAQQSLRIIEGPPGVFHGVISVKTDELGRMDITMPLFLSKGPNDPNNIKYFKKQVSNALMGVRNEGTKSDFLAEELAKISALQKEWKGTTNADRAQEIFWEERARLNSMLSLMDRPRFPGQERYTKMSGSNGIDVLRKQHQDNVAQSTKQYKKSYEKQLAQKQAAASESTQVAPVDIKVKSLDQKIQDGSLTNGAVIERVDADGAKVTLTYQTMEKNGDVAILYFRDDQGKEVRYFYDEFVNDSKSLKLIDAPRGPPPAAVKKVDDATRPELLRDGKPVKKHKSKKTKIGYEGADGSSIHVEGTIVDPLNVKGQEFTFRPGHPPDYAGGGIHASDDLIQLPPIKLKYEPLAYQPPKTGESAADVMKDDFKMSEAPVVKYEGKGGTKRVYEHPTDPNKVVKVFDPSLVADPGVIPGLIQREMAVYHYLLEIEQAYIKAGKIPPFKVARITSTPEQLAKGIIIQDVVAGQHLGDVWQASSRGETPDFFNRYINELNRHQEGVLNANLEVNGFHLKINHSQPNRDGRVFQYGEHAIGIDWGANFNNAKIVNDPEFGGQPIPVMYDW